MKCNQDIRIYGDEILLSWAFENLIKNSIDSIKSVSGKISIIVTGKNRDKCIIDFVDSGAGIPRRYWKKIFKPGYTTKPRGWGVGLSLTKRIIEEIHSGKTYVQSSRSENAIIRVVLNKAK